MASIIKQFSKELHSGVVTFDSLFLCISCISYKQLSQADTLALVKRCIARRGLPQLTDSAIEHICSSIRALDRHLLVAADVSEEAASLELGRVASPVISRCLECSSILTNVQHESAAAKFYEFGAQAQAGTLYVKHCDSCGLTYQLDGYQRTADYSAKRITGCKLPYAAEHQHPDWFRSTSQTVISNSLLDLQAGLWGVGQLGFRPTAQALNYAAAVKGQAFRGSAAAAPYTLSDRSSLNPKRFAEAYMRRGALIAVLESGPDFLPNVDLNQDMDVLLDMATPLLTHSNVARYFHHCDTSAQTPLCGRYEQYDGMWKLYRSVCSCALPPPPPSGPGAPLFPVRRCEETPKRLDPLRRCEGCIAREQAGGQQQHPPVPPASEQQPGARPQLPGQAGTQQAVQQSAPTAAAGLVRLTRARAKQLGISLPDPRAASMPSISGQDDLIEAGLQLRSARQGEGRRGGEAEAAARIEAERFDPSTQQVFYKVRWSDDLGCSWETTAGLGAGADGLLAAWRQLAVPQVQAVSLFDSLDEAAAGDDDDTYSGPRAPDAPASTSAVAAALPSASVAASQSAVPASGGAVCNKYVAGRFAKKTCGVVACFCACGYPQAPMELVDPESKSNILTYILERYRFHSMVRPGKDFKIMGYDNMCNLARSLEKVRHLHPKLEELARQVIKVVDKFHFKGHTGSFCHKNTNPRKWPQLKDANMSVAEQAFQQQGRLKRSFRYFNRSRFQYMLQDVCRLQQRMRDMGIVTLSQIAEDAAADAEDAEVMSTVQLV